MISQVNMVPVYLGSTCALQSGIRFMRVSSNLYSFLFKRVELGGLSNE